MTVALLLSLGFPAISSADGPYAPYEFLIGEWDVSVEGGAPAMVTRFRWGPNRSYVTYASALLTPAGEQAHFEGVLMWNGVSKNLDMLTMLDLTERAAVQERGTLSIDDTGTVVRAIVASYSEGAAPIGGAKAGPAGLTVRFRQTYRQLASGRVATSALRESSQGWVPTFPGSDGMVMVRRRAN